MASDGSVTHKIKEVRQGSSEAYEAIFNRYIAGLVDKAAGKMQKMPGVRPASLDPDIAAQSALRSVLSQIKAGRAERLRNRNDLLHLLLKRLKAKIIDQWRRELAQKRGGGKFVDIAELNARGPAVEDDAVDVFSTAEESISGFGRQPTPQEIAVANELFARATAVLPDDNYRRIACLSLDGHNSSAIAREVNRSVRTVESRLKTIRQLWLEHLA